MVSHFTCRLCFHEPKASEKQPTSEMTHHIPRMKSVIDVFDILSVIQALKCSDSQTSSREFKSHQ